MNNVAEHFDELKDMFLRTREGIHDFMSILTPRIENAKDEHERLYYHHIYEEEEQRLDRLNALLPKLEFYLENDVDTENNLEFIRLLQDISLEKFGLHNFLEHLDLSLFSFKGTEHEDNLTKMRDLTDSDYQAIKGIMTSLNERFDGAALAPGSIPTDEKDEVNNSLKVEKYITTTENSQLDSNQPTMPQKKQSRRLTVGSLKQSKEVL